jgi:hypothetical protein
MVARAVRGKGWVCGEGQFAATISSQTLSGPAALVCGLTSHHESMGSPYPLAELTRYYRPLRRVAAATSTEYRSLWWYKAQFEKGQTL